MAPTDHWLLSGLGLHLREASYTLDGRQVVGTISATALARLLPEAHRPAHLLVLSSAAAWTRHEAKVRAEAEALGMAVHVDAVAEDDPDEADAARLVARVLDRLPVGCRLTLDLTGGERPPSLALYAAASLLAALGEAELAGAWYARFRGDQPAPFLRQDPVVAMPAWVHAARVLVDQGSATALADLAAAHTDEHLPRQLRELGLAHDGVLPLELGLVARQLGPHLRGKTGKRLRKAVPFAGRLLTHVERALVELEVASTDRKAKLALDDTERSRQLRLVRRYMDRGQVQRAVLLAREWVVNRFLPDGDAWLRTDDRHPVERRLGVLAHHPHRHTLPDDVLEVATLWKDLTEPRNHFAHAGMTRDKLDLGKAQAQARALIARLETWATRPAPTLDTAASDRLLITPLGLAPGVLLSALHHVRPDRAVVIGSADSLAAVDEACARAGWSGEVVRWALEDPHAGFEVIRDATAAMAHPRRCRELAAPLDDVFESLLGASEVHVNLTGGTTLLGHAATRLGELAGRLGADVKRLALVDRRPLSVQREAPWVYSERVDLD